MLATDRRNAMATAVKETAVAETCPRCSTKARKVAPLTVRSLVHPELADTVGEDTYRFCESPACDLVYFSEKHPDLQFHRGDIRVRVGQKETEPPIQVCYCFDWTTDDIERELRLIGNTTVPGRIRQKIQQGYCQCETMNPQGYCCLGNVNRAVKEIRAALARQPGVTVGRISNPSHSVPGPPTNEKGAFLATLGAVFIAVVGSACCWLPLLLIAFGFSAAGVGSFFEQYRPYFLAATFALLGTAWYFTYRTTIWKSWTRLRGKSVPAPAVEACCTSESAPVSAHSCCSTEQESKPVAVHSCCGAEPRSEPEECCAPQGKATASQQTPRRSTVRRFNQVMLCIATIMIVLFALFPHWIGLLLRAGNPTAAVNTDDQHQIVLQLTGMTCEGCASIVEKALRSAPGVSAATVDYEKAEAVVFVPMGQDVPRDAILQAVRQTGFSATFRK
jgi:copper chaperone CopZ